MNKQKKIKVRNPIPTKRERILLDIHAIITLFISAGLCAIAAYCLISPNNFTIGGASGIAIMLEQKGILDQNVTVFLINTPLVLISFFFVKKRFAVLTLIHIGFQWLWLTLLKNINEVFTIKLGFEGGLVVFAGIGAAVCLGTGIALVFKIGGCSGGADVIAVMLQRKRPAPSIAWMLFSVNAVIIGSSFFVLYQEGKPLADNLLPIILSIFELFIESKVNDAVSNGFQSAIEFKVITDKPEEMATALMEELDRGATAIPVKGMYTGKEHTMVMCIVGRKQVHTLKKIMLKVDPEAFAVMSGVSQVVGLGFYSSNDN